MPCYSPLRAYRGSVGASGKRGIVFQARGAKLPKPLDLPCGQCIGCRLERSRQWAIRCVHEASLHEENSWLTLTYDDDHLPPHGSLVVRDFQLFMKRLRKKFSDRAIRFFECGEYGEQLGRPHYHACIFGFDFPDKRLYSERDGLRVYESDLADRLWRKGAVRIGDLNFETAAYTARYCLKKVTGDQAPEFYGDRKPEYTTMSRRPGIAAGWYEKFKFDVYGGDRDGVVVRGFEMKPPKFYDKLFEREDAKRLAQKKRDRIWKAIERGGDSSISRLRTREVVKKARLSTLSRNFEKNGG